MPAAATAGFVFSASAAFTAGAHTESYGHAEHDKPVNVDFEQEVKIDKPGCAHVIACRTGHDSKPFDSHGRTFLEKTCND